MIKHNNLTLEIILNYCGPSLQLFIKHNYWYIDLSFATSFNFKKRLIGFTQQNTRVSANSQTSVRVSLPFRQAWPPPPPHLCMHVQCLCLHRGVDEGPNRLQLPDEKMLKTTHYVSAGFIQCIDRTFEDMNTNEVRLFLVTIHMLYKTTLKGNHFQFVFI